VSACDLRKKKGGGKRYLSFPKRGRGRGGGGGGGRGRKGVFDICGPGKGGGKRGRKHQLLFFSFVEPRIKRGDNAGRDPVPLPIRQKEKKERPLLKAVSRERGKKKTTLLARKRVLARPKGKKKREEEGGRLDVVGRKQSPTGKKKGRGEKRGLDSLRKGGEGRAGSRGEGPLSATKGKVLRQRRRRAKGSESGGRKRGNT